MNSPEGESIEDQGTVKPGGYKTFHEVNWGFVIWIFVFHIRVHLDAP